MYEDQRPALAELAIRQCQTILPAKVASRHISRIRLHDPYWRSRLQAVNTITFELDGTVRSANDNFLRTMGYSLEEIRGLHHSMFVEPGYRASNEYRAF